MSAEKKCVSKMSLGLIRSVGLNCFRREFTTTAVNNGKHYPLVIVGGGAGGCAVASRACRALGAGKVAVVEPSKFHYYQAMWTLVGGGVKTINQSVKPTETVLPKPCVHHLDRVAKFDPTNNTITLEKGEELTYDYLVIGLGIQVNYDKVEGLVDALREDPMVCSNYDKNYVQKTFPAIQKFQGGTALFTFPNTPIKCPGAPQKIMYLADDYWRKNGIRDKADIKYLSSLNVIFWVKKYAERLMKVAQKKNIDLHFRKNLIAVDHKERTVTVQLLDSDKGETETFKYDFLHATPPMSAPDVLKSSSVPLVDATGFLDVNKATLQHNNFPNIFGLGDCTTVPIPKTAAAVASQNRILFHNLTRVMEGKQPQGLYDGYTSCPLITSYKTCILAEFDFNAEPMETFPFDQGNESRFMYHLKKDIMPQIYFRLMLNGKWSGPKFFRKVFHLGASR